MGYASRSGRAATSSSSPRAHAICDRCGARVNHDTLVWQYDWRGPTMLNTRKLVCSRCVDVPQQQLRAITLPADPMPISNPRIEYFSTYESDVRQTSGQNTIDPKTGLPVPGGDTRVTQDGNTRSPQATGEPPYGLNQTPGVDRMAVPDNIGGNNPGLPYNYTQVPKAGNSK